MIHLDSLRLIPDTSAPAAFFQKRIEETFPSTKQKTVSLSYPAPMRSFSLSDGYSERIIYRQREDRFPHDTYSPPVHRSRRNRNGCQEPVSSYGQRKTEFSKFSLTLLKSQNHCRKKYNLADNFVNMIASTLFYDS